MSIEKQPTHYMLAGPNGAGKTTYAFRHMRAVTGFFLFVNLDEIARGVSPLEPSQGQQRAARVAHAMTRSMIDEGKSFSLETTLSGKTHLRTLAAARSAGLAISLLYFAAPDVQTCLARIARRVQEGGHDVAPEDVRRRFSRSLANLPAYSEKCDVWRIFDASVVSPKVVAEGRGNCLASLQPPHGLPARLTQWLASLPPCPEALR